MKIALYVDEDSQDSTLLRALPSRGIDVIAAVEATNHARLLNEPSIWNISGQDLDWSLSSRAQSCDKL
jgi:hypothetical protein